MNRRGLLAMVHIARKDLGLDEDSYRDMLEAVAGVRSASELDDAALLRVVENCKRLGWVPRAPKERRSDAPQVRMIWALWHEMSAAGIVRSPTSAGLRAFVRSQTGVSDPEWLSPEQAGLIIEALKAWRARKGAAS